jgi:O-acetyl-ADP-ribose deacetylase (regulator of RNase III)
MRLNVQLRTTDPRHADLFRATLGDMPEMTVQEGPLLCGDLAKDAVIAPTNSFGYLDSGLDGLFSRRFGARLQRALQEQIACDWAGELPLGEAVIVPTGDFGLPFLVAAPASRLPGTITAEPNMYLSLLAALRAVDDWNALDEGPFLESVVLPDMSRYLPGWTAERLSLQLRCALDAWRDEREILRTGNRSTRAA